MLKPSNVKQTSTNLSNKNKNETTYSDKLSKLANQFNKKLKNNLNLLENNEDIDFFAPENINLHSIYIFT